MEKGAARVKSGLRACGCSATCAPMDMKTERERRLAEALRANLRRRKAQARERDTTTPNEERPLPGRQSEPQ